MAQLDDDIGLVMKNSRTWAVDDNTIVVFTTDNGPKSSLARWRSDAVRRQSKGTVLEGVSRARDPSLSWPCAADSVQNGISPAWTGSRPSRRGRQSEHREELLKGKTIATGRTRTIWMATTKWPITGKGPSAS